MTDQNSTYRAENYSYPDDDPLAELARIVAGDSREAPREQVAAPAMAHEVEAHDAEETAEDLDSGFDLEAELMRELGEAPQDEAVSPAQVSADEETDAEFAEAFHAELSAEESGSNNASAELASEQEFDLQEELLAELTSGFEEQETHSAYGGPSEGDVSEGLVRDSGTPALNETYAAQSHAAAAPVPDDLDAEFDEIEALAAGAAARDVAESVAQMDASTGDEPADDLEDFFAQGFAETLEMEQDSGHAETQDISGVAADLGDHVQVHADAAAVGDPEVDFGEAFKQQVWETEHGEGDDTEALIASLEQDFENAFSEELSASGSAPEVDGDQSQSPYGAPSMAPTSVHAELDEPAVPGIDEPGRYQAYDPAADFEQEFGQEFAADPAYGIDDHQPVMTGESRRSSGFKLALGALGVALVAGLGVVAWGVFGDSGGPSGDAPVIVKADNEPVKVKPEEPGGKEIANTENQVYDSVAGTNSMEPEQKTLVDSRQTPVEVEQVAEVPAKSGDRVEPQQVSDISQNAPLGLAPKRVSTFTVKPDGTIIAPPSSLQGSQSTGSELALADPVAVDAGTDAAPETILLGSASTGDIPVPTPSPRQPEAAPVQAAEAAPVAVAPKPVATQPATPKPAAAPAAVPQPAAENAPTRIASATPAPAAAPTTSSEWKVQVASQRSQEAAKASYDNLRRRFASIFDGRQASIESAQVNGSTFYRVKIPSASKSDANEFCSRLKAAGGSCFVSR
ncbi:MAG: SPOR domain-containing protein [Nitratireductor sp.]|nr:SPOR domain-containing protein [Nitratireductor sp.]